MSVPDAPPLILNLRQAATVPCVRVDRGTPWGNPFVMRNHSAAERDRVCNLFEQYAVWRLTVEPDWLAPLRGQHLACWCAPKRCHAETLRRLANREGEERDGRTYEH